VERDLFNETMKLIQSLHRDNYNLKSIYPLVKAAEDCMQESYKRKNANKGAAKASLLYYLLKYVFVEVRKAMIVPDNI